jgi:phosphatidate cytidylyltransferase
MGRELALRTSSGILLLLVVALCSLMGGLILLGFVMVVSILGYMEYRRMVSKRGIPVEGWAGIAGVMVVVAGMSSYIPYKWMPEFLLFLYIVFLFLFELRRRDIEGIAKALVGTAIGVIYTGWMFGHLARIEGIEGIGGKGVLWVVFVTSGCDTGCYIVGKAIGRRKIVPRISQGKSLEGSLGGMAFGILIGIGFQRILLPSIQPYLSCILGALISVLGQIGDLCESVAKRYSGVKDSGDLIPGHGGVLDRIDSLIFASPASYYLLLSWV